MATTAAAPRCAACNRGLAFDEWSVGLDLCSRCVGAESGQGPAATYTPAASRPLRQQMRQEQADLQRMLDDIPDELIDELIAALEEEAAGDAGQPQITTSPLRDVLHEIGFNKSHREGLWASWGFVAGFGGNLLLAKYAQMSAGAPVSELIAPVVLGGLVAGVTCAAIGWTLARLRER